MASAVGSNETIEPDHALLQDREVEDAQRQEFVNIAVDLINTTINELLVELDPLYQQKIDEKIMLVWLFILSSEYN